MQFRCSKALRNPHPPESVISAAGITFAAIQRDNPGAGAFRGDFLIGPIPMDVKSDTAWCGGDKDAPALQPPNAGQ